MECVRDPGALAGRWLVPAAGCSNAQARSPLGHRVERTAGVAAAVGGWILARRRPARTEGAELRPIRLELRDERDLAWQPADDSRAVCLFAAAASLCTVDHPRSVGSRAANRYLRGDDLGLGVRDIGVAVPGSARVPVPRRLEVDSADPMDRARRGGGLSAGPGARCLDRRSELSDGAA